jgi:hypothetical protein
MKERSKIGVSWIELVLVMLLTMLGMGFWALADRLVKDVLAHSEPEAKDFAERRGVPGRERVLNLAEAEWKASVALLVEQRLDIDRQAAKLKTLEGSYPVLRGVSAPVASAVPAEVAKEYREVQRQLRTASILSEQLQKCLQEVEDRLSRSAKAVRLVRRSANREWQAAKVRSDLARRGWTFLGAGSASFLALLAIGWVLSRPTGQRLQIQRGLVLGSSATLLAILYAYQLFRGLSLAIASPVLLLGFWRLLCALPTDTKAPEGTA